MVPAPCKVTYSTEKSTESEGSPDAEKSTAVSVSSTTGTVTENRRLGGGWAPRPQLRRLVPGNGNGLGWVVLRLLGGPGTGLSSSRGRDCLGD